MFLPAATLALMVLSILAMLSYRNVLVNFTAAARTDALRQARTAAGLLPADARTSGALRRAFNTAADAALLHPDGSVAASIGRMTDSDPFAPLADAPREAQTAGPRSTTSHRIVAWLPLRNGLILRLESPQPALAEEWVRWRRLMIVVTTAVGAIATLLLLYMRRLFAPIDNLLRTAREFDDATPSEGDDEIEFLVHRFESAMAALKHQRRQQSTDDQPLDQQIEALQQTFSHLESGMALMDLQANVLALNDVGAAILDLDPKLLPLALDQLLAAHSDLADLIGASLATGTPLRRKECTVQVSGRPRALGLTLSPLSRRDGTRRGWIVLFADLTDAHQQAERDRLSSSLDHLAELSAGLAHELRNSLASMQGYAALLQRAELPINAAEDTAELQREINQLHRIVEDFLSFARPGDARLAPVDLIRLAHRCAGDPSLSGAPVKVRSEDLDVNQVNQSDLSVWSVAGDEQLLHRLLRNLLLNAVRAQAQSTQPDASSGRNPSDAEPVVVTLSATSDAVTVRVEDTGPGLSRAAQERLFVPFATDTAGGSGLGLAVARRIADLHRAELSVTNRTDTSGVVATVTFERR